MSAASQAATLITVYQPVAEAHEGRRLSVYRDSLGIPTVGIGFNLQRSDAEEFCESCGVVLEAVLSGAVALTDEQCDCLYQKCASEVLEWLTEIFPALFTYSLNRQIALLDMGFNLGQTRFGGFRQMIAAVLAGNWAQAEAQALNSAWATQVGQRAVQDGQWLASG